jgi:hypothetical protein
MSAATELPKYALAPSGGERLTEGVGARPDPVP